MFYLILAILTFKMESADGSSYVTTPGDIPTYGTINEADEYTSKPVPGGLPNEVAIFVDKRPNYVWDIAGSVKDLIIYPYHGGPNQRFVFDKKPDGTNCIKNGNGCIEWDPVRKSFEKQPC